MISFSKFILVLLISLIFIFSCEHTQKNVDTNNYKSYYFGLKKHEKPEDLFLLYNEITFGKNVWDTAFITLGKGFDVDHCLVRKIYFKDGKVLKAVKQTDELINFSCKHLAYYICKNPTLYFEVYDCCKKQQRIIQLNRYKGKPERMVLH